MPIVGAFDFIIRCHPTSLMNLVHILFLNFMLPRNIGFHFLKVTTFNISILGEYEFFMRQRLLQSLFKIAYLLLKTQPYLRQCRLGQNVCFSISTCDPGHLFWKTAEVFGCELLFRIHCLIVHVQSGFEGWRQYSLQYYSWVVNLGDWT